MPFPGFFGAGSSAPPTWTPPSITPLAWQYPNTTYVQDEPYTTIADGETVGRWFDRSGSGSHVIKGAAQATTYRANGWGTGKAAIEFTAVTQGFASGPSAVAVHLSGTNKPFSLFLTLQLDALTAGIQGLFHVTDSASNAEIKFEITGTGCLRLSKRDLIGTGQVVTGTRPLAIGHNRVGFINDAVGTVALWVGGALDVVVPAPVGFASFDAHALGGTDNINPNSVDGMFRELIIAPTAASGADWNNFLAYSYYDSGA